jgi:glucose/arabinose dehydrogenase
VKLDGNNAVSYAPFATGWLTNDSAWGRPVDVLTLPDGSLLISDDFAGAVYRIYYLQ